MPCWTPATAGKKYRDFIAEVQEKAPIKHFPQRCRFPAARALWHEHAGNQKLAKRALNQALVKGGGVDALSGRLDQGRVEHHLQAIPREEGVNGQVSVRRCPRCRKPLGTCSPSCIRRQEEAARKRAARAAGAASSSAA